MFKMTASMIAIAMTAITLSATIAAAQTPTPPTRVAIPLAAKANARAVVTAGGRDAMPASPLGANTMKFVSVQGHGVAQRLAPSPVAGVKPGTQSK
jgi:hypothetical protein